MAYFALEDLLGIEFISLNIKIISYILRCLHAESYLGRISVECYLSHIYTVINKFIDQNNRKTMNTI